MEVQTENLVTNQSVSVNLRPFRPADNSFLYSSWIKSFRDSAENYGLPGGEYYQRQKKKIESILARPSAAVFVVFDPEDENHIYGYIVMEMGETVGMLHYMYVKENFRKFGIAGEMLKVLRRLPCEKFVFTHLPANGEIGEMFKRHGIEYQPGVGK